MPNAGVASSRKNDFDRHAGDHALGQCEAVLDAEFRLEQRLVVVDLAPHRDLLARRRVAEDRVPVGREHRLLHLLRRASRRKCSADDGAHARAGDTADRNPHLFEHLQHADMGDAARAAARQRKADPRLRCRCTARDRRDRRRRARCRRCRCPLALGTGSRHNGPAGQQHRRVAGAEVSFHVPLHKIGGRRVPAGPSERRGLYGGQRGADARRRLRGACVSGAPACRTATSYAPQRADLIRSPFGRDAEAGVRRDAFRLGVRRGAPLLMPTAIWGLVAGVAMIKTGLTTCAGAGDDAVRVRRQCADGLAATDCRRRTGRGSRC